jgi:hypothetical protein
VKRTFAWVLLVGLLLAACSRLAAPPPAQPSSTPPLSEDSVLGLLRRYLSNPKEAVTSGLVVGGEKGEFVEEVKPGQRLSHRDSPRYVTDPSGKDWRIRLAAWTENEVFAILSFENVITKLPDTMKWHLVLLDGRWRVENHGDVNDEWRYRTEIPDTDLVLAGVRVGEKPEQVEKRLGKPSRQQQTSKELLWQYSNLEVRFDAERGATSIRTQAGVTGRGLQIGMPLENARIIYGIPSGSDPVQQTFWLGQGEGMLRVGYQKGIITELTVELAPKPEYQLPSGAEEVPEDERKVLEALGRQVWELVVAGNKEGLKRLLSSETSELEIYVEGIGEGRGLEYEKGLDALIRWGQDKGRTATLNEILVGFRKNPKNPSALDGVGVHTSAGILLVYVSRGDKKIIKIFEQSQPSGV